MPIQASHPSSCRGPWAELCCHIDLECSRVSCRAEARGHCLALSPGTVTETAALCGGTQAFHITLPACEEYVTEQLDLAPLCPAADSTPPCIFTTTTKQASACAVRAGDAVTYQIIFTNHSSIRMDMVRIYDDVPAEVVSIRPAPAPGETLKTGIAMGELGPGQSAVLTYDVTADFTCGLPMASRAWAQFCYTDHCGCVHQGTSGCRCCEVFQLPDCRPVCRCVRRQFSICDFSRMRYCYIYHRGVDCFRTECGCNLVVKFGIAVKYIDCCGRKRGKFFEDSVQVTNLADGFDPSGSRIRLTGLVCDVDDQNLITASFRLTLAPAEA